MSQEHWSSYWQTGVLTSLPQDFPVNYDGEIADYWRAILSPLSGSVHVVDVCTGNLALPLLMMTELNRADLELQITAIDKAIIDKEAIGNRFPKVVTALQNVNVYDHTDVININQVLDEPVDLITSQYGIEYADTDAVAQPLYDALKEGGRLAFVAHATDSAVTAYMEQEKQVFDELTEMHLFELLAEFGSGKITPVMFQQEAKRQVKILGLKVKSQPRQLTQIIYQALESINIMSIKQLIDQKDKIRLFGEQHWQAQLRAVDLLKVITKMQRDPLWYLPFEDCGFQLMNRQTIIYQGKHHAGVGYLFMKNKR